MALSGSCQGLCFKKVARLRLATLFEKESRTGGFLWNSHIFQEYLFWGTSANSCFCFKKYSFILEVCCFYPSCSLKFWEPGIDMKKTER